MSIRRYGKRELSRRCRRWCGGATRWRSGRDAVQLRNDGHDGPLEAVQPVLPVLLVVVQIRVHSGSLPRDRRAEVDTGQQIGLPTAFVAISGGAGGQNVVLLPDDRQGQVVRQRQRLAGGPDGELGGVCQQRRRLRRQGIRIVDDGVDLVVAEAELGEVTV